jgi:excisionase family DNA binding protein
MKSLWNIKEVSCFLNVKESYVYRLTSENRIPHLKLGGHLRFSPEQIEKWLSQKAQNHIRLLMVPGGF